MANDIIGVVTIVEDDGYGQQTWKMVTLGTGEILKVKSGRDGVLKAKWGLLQEGVAIKFTMKDFIDKDKIAHPYVQDIETVEDELPEPVKRTTTPVPSVIAPQERGMWWKQLGDDLRSGHIDKETHMGKVIRLRYFAEMFRVLDIDIKEEKAP